MSQNPFDPPRTPSGRPAIVAVVLGLILVGAIVLGIELRATSKNDEKNVTPIGRDAGVPVRVPAPVDAAAISDPSTIAIPTATFMMGSTPDDRENAFVMCISDDTLPGCDQERPIYARETERRVEVTGFRLDAREVMVADFVAWLATTKRPAIVYPGVVLDSAHRVTIVPGWTRHPISSVTWDEANAYCADHAARLPTEAEWELAARGTSRRTFPWGTNAPQCKTVAYARAPGHYCFGQGISPSDVGTATGDVTPEGVHDLGGNVSEWTSDAATPRPECKDGPCRDPVNPLGSSDKRVVRGGNWFGGLAWLRAAGRGEVAARERRNNIGFRCAYPGDHR